MITEGFEPDRANGPIDRLRELSLIAVTFEDELILAQIWKMLDEGGVCVINAVDDEFHFKIRLKEGQNLDGTEG